MAVLNDVISRQASLAKANARNAQQGPLNHALKSDDTSPVLFHSSVTDQLRARSSSSVKSARERDQLSRDERISGLITAAQNVATVARGRSIDKRMSAAQSVASSRSASRSSLHR